MKLTTEQAAQVLGWPASRVQRMAKEVKIPGAEKIGKGEKNHRFRFDSKVIRAFKETCKVPAPAKMDVRQFLPEVPEGFIPIREAAKRGGFSNDSRLFAYINNGTLDRVKVNNRTYVRESQVPTSTGVQGSRVTIRKKIVPTTPVVVETQHVETNQQVESLRVVLARIEEAVNKLVKIWS